MGNSFGQYFRMISWGESHGGSVGLVIDGCPPKLDLSEDDIQKELDRRKPGQSSITTQRKETDKITIHSGVYQGQTLGTPLAMSVTNEDARPEDYKELKTKYRPSHADYTYEAKFGIRNPEGGGRSSARETIARVAAGAIARKILHKTHGIKIVAYVDSINRIKIPLLETFPNIDDVERSPVRCPDTETASSMIKLIEETKAKGDSLGGTIVCRIINTPVGFGGPVFDRLEADLAKAMLSIPATKGFEIGSGFSGCLMKGSEHNDVFKTTECKVTTLTNFSGGVQGGISNGEEISFRVAFKPTSTILQKQKTSDIQGKNVDLLPKGRHDPCVLPRAVPIVEAMAALVLVDHAMAQRAQTGTFDFQ